MLKVENIQTNIHFQHQDYEVSQRSKNKTAKAS